MLGLGRQRFADDDDGDEVELQAEALAVFVSPRGADFLPEALLVLVLGDGVSAVCWLGAGLMLHHPTWGETVRPASSTRPLAGRCMVPMRDVFAAWTAARSRPASARQQDESARKGKVRSQAGREDLRCVARLLFPPGQRFGVRGTPPPRDQVRDDGSGLPAGAFPFAS